MAGPRGVQVRVTVVGQQRAQAACRKRMGKPLWDSSRAGLEAAGRVMVPIVAAEAPVLTGATRDSVRLLESRSPGMIRGGPTTWYKHFVIKGTKRGVKANPWVARGARKARVAARTAFSSVLWWRVKH